MRNRGYQRWSAILATAFVLWSLAGAAIADSGIHGDGSNEVAPTASELIEAAQLLGRGSDDPTSAAILDLTADQLTAELGDGNAWKPGSPRWAKVHARVRNDLGDILKLSEASLQVSVRQRYGALLEAAVERNTSVDQRITLIRFYRSRPGAAYVSLNRALSPLVVGAMARVAAIRTGRERVPPCGIPEAQMERAKRLLAISDGMRQVLAQSRDPDDMVLYVYACIIGEPLLEAGREVSEEDIRKIQTFVGSASAEVFARVQIEAFQQLERDPRLQALFTDMNERIEARKPEWRAFHRQLTTPEPSTSAMGRLPARTANVDSLSKRPPVGKLPVPPPPKPSVMKPIDLKARLNEEQLEFMKGRRAKKSGGGHGHTIEIHERQ